MNKYLNRMLLALVVTTLSACTVLPDAEEIQIYHLPTAPISADYSVETLNTTLSVAEPTSLRALDTARISTFNGSQMQRYYAGARWADRAPVLVQQHLLQTLQASGLFAQVLNADSGLPVDYEVRSELRAFQIESTSAGDSAHVAVQVTLVHRADRKVVASTVLREQVAVAGSSMQNTTAALGQATDKVSSALAKWVYDSLRQKR